MHKVSTLEADIASGLTKDSFLWKDLPFPLPFLSTATYELRVLRQQQVGDVKSEPFIASSPPFTIIPADEDDYNSGQTATNGTAGGTQEQMNPSQPKRGPKTKTIVAASLAVALVVGISVYVFLCMRRRQKKIVEERRKERHELVID
ncbi:hypothetical protein F4777DRAFT_559025 [Nemania sp. FL0916]|nr:hypothetical protein F4777DRAFT_559025 [Nemania sp. FL0916]